MFQINSGRQHKTAGEQRVKAADLVSGTPQKAFWLPPGAYNITGQIIPLTAFNSATSDTVDVGTLASGSAYKNDADVAATSAVALSGLPTSTSDGSWVYVTWTGTGAAPTAGEFLLAFEYAMLDNSQFDHGENR